MIYCFADSGAIPDSSTNLVDILKNENDPLREKVGSFPFLCRVWSYVFIMADVEYTRDSTSVPCHVCFWSLNKIIIQELYL